MRAAVFAAFAYALANFVLCAIRLELRVGAENPELTLRAISGVLMLLYTSSAALLLARALATREG